MATLQRQLIDIEARMASFQNEGATLEIQLCQSPSPANMAELGKRLNTVHEALQAAEEQWLAVSGEIESLSTSTCS